MSGKKNMQKIWGTIIALLSMAVGGGLLFYQQQFQKTPTMKFESRYQVVWLKTGVAYFGKLENWGSDHPILREVYQLKNQVDGNNQKSNLVMVKREQQELYAPGYIILDAKDIMVVEPVAAGSQIGQTLHRLQNP